MIKTDFIKLYEELNILNEAKQDKINFMNFFIHKAGYPEEQAKDWVVRFDKLKSQLKSPENDYYYWIKRGNPFEIRNLIRDMEHNLETKQLDKQVVAEGSELVKETEHWKIYHITNYEAARHYGIDSKWCITGINNYGRKYWDQYTDDGNDFYFIITKQDYNPRGKDSKFAFAINYDLNYYEIYNQRDTKVYLEEIPYWSEIKIPGINLENYSPEAPDLCDSCGEAIFGDNVFAGPNGDGVYCASCYDNLFFECDNCYNSFDQRDMMEGPNGEMYCQRCWQNKYIKN